MKACYRASDGGIPKIVCKIFIKGCYFAVSPSRFQLASESLKIEFFLFHAHKHKEITYGREEHSGNRNLMHSVFIYRSKLQQQKQFFFS